MRRHALIGLWEMMVATSGSVEWSGKIAMPDLRTVRWTLGLFHQRAAMQRILLRTRSMPRRFRRILPKARPTTAAATCGPEFYSRSARTSALVAPREPGFEEGLTRADGAIKPGFPERIDAPLMTSDMPAR
jgi:hypothetical protein